MPPKKQQDQRELESDLRKSLRVLPVQACITGATGILLLLWHSWFSWLAFGLTLFALVVDAVNVVYCRYHLRKWSESLQQNTRGILPRRMRIIAWWLKALRVYAISRIGPTRPPAWWKQHPKRGSGGPRPPTACDGPRLQAGDVVRLRGKPDRPRRVLRSEWHGHRHEYVYVVETSAPQPFEPYWFLDQLAAEPPTTVLS